MEIDFPRGLGGHSDADVLVHAVVDALLGAAGLEDIGAHFGTEDPRYRNVRSLRLLEEVQAAVAAGGFTIGNVDATLIAAAPALRPHFPQMRENLARVLKVDPERINLKASSANGIGALGAGDGMACLAVALLREEKG